MNQFLMYSFGMGIEKLEDERMSSAEVVSQRVNYLLFLNRPLQHRELALMLGMSSSKFSQKLNGLTKWSLDDVNLIADTFDVSTDWLVGRVALEADAPIAQRQSYGLLIRRS